MRQNSHRTRACFLVAQCPKQPGAVAELADWCFKMLRRVSRFLPARHLLGEWQWSKHARRDPPEFRIGRHKIHLALAGSPLLLHRGPVEIWRRHLRHNGEYGLRMLIWTAWCAW